MWPTFCVLFLFQNKTQKVGHMYVTANLLNVVAYETYLCIVLCIKLTAVLPTALSWQLYLLLIIFFSWGCQKKSGPALGLSSKDNLAHLP